MALYFSNKIGFILKALSDYKCGEFHITPVLTLAWPDEKLENIKWGYSLALEWGFWAIFIGLYKPKYKVK